MPACGGCCGTPGGVALREAQAVLGRLWVEKRDVEAKLAEAQAVRSRLWIEKREVEEKLTEANAGRSEAMKARDELAASLKVQHQVTDYWRTYAHDLEAGLRKRK